MARQDFPGRVGWLRRLCGGLVAEAMWWVGCGGYVVRNAGNKAQLRPAGAGALPELVTVSPDCSVLVVEAK